MPYKNIDPNLWGPSLWTFLHYLTLAYPDNPTEEEQERMYDFLASLQIVIPCQKCRINFKSYLNEMNSDVLSTKNTLVRWLFNVHNLVNKNTGKPQFSYDDFIKKYSQMKINEEIKVESKDESNEKIKEYFDNKMSNGMSNANAISNNIYIIICIIVIIAIIIYLNKKL